MIQFATVEDLEQIMEHVNTLNTKLDTLVKELQAERKKK